MPVVEVACPKCNAKLKAPDDAAGKKAKCKKCGNSFRIPGGNGTPSDSVGDGQALSVMNVSVPAALPVDDDDKTEVMMAEAIPEDDRTMPLPAQAPPPKPAKDLSSLPSADAFDFPKPPQPAKPAFGAAKQAAPPPAPAKPAPPLPAPPPVQAKPASKPPAPPAPAKPAAAPPQALSLDDEPPVAKALPAEAIPAAPLPAAPAPANDNPFAFGDSPAQDEKPAKKKRRDEDDEEPRPKKKKRDDNEDDEPKEKKKRSDDDQQDEPKAKKKKRDEDDEDDAPRAKKKAKAASDDEPFNPFANFEPGPAEPVETGLLWETEEELKKKKKKKRNDDNDDPKAKKKKKGDEEDDEETEKPRYRRPEEKGSGIMMAILLTLVIGVVALGLGITAVVVYVKNRKPPEQAKEEKKEEPPPVPPDAGWPGDPNPAGPGPGPGPEPKPKDKGPDPKPKEPEKTPSGRDAVSIRPAKAFTVAPLPNKLQPADKPRAGMVLDAAPAAVKRVFPPINPQVDDTYVLTQLSAGAGGTGEKLAFDAYSASSKARDPAARIVYDGDGLANPIADFTISPKGAFFLAATGGKLHVWSVGDKRKIVDGISPYADKPEHEKSGVAAAFFAADPNQVILVSTAGGVLLYDLTTRKPVKDFIPPDAVTGRMYLGRNVAKAEGGRSVVVAVAGVLYQVKADPSLEVLRKYDLGGDVKQSYGLAVAGTPGRILYAFETADGKKEKAVLGLTLGATAKGAIYRIPDALGEPKGSALWAGDKFGGLVVDRGVLWFDDDEGQFNPLVLTQPPGPGQFFGDETYFWYVIPHPKDAKKSILAGLGWPSNDFGEFQKSFSTNQPLRAVRIDAEGLAK